METIKSFDLNNKVFTYIKLKYRCAPIASIQFPLRCLPDFAHLFGLDGVLLLAQVPHCKVQTYLCKLVIIKDRELLNLTKYHAMKTYWGVEV
jgi:hypothetical protein